LGEPFGFADSEYAASLQVFQNLGAEMVGDWATDGYRFEHSASVVNGRFVGLVIDQRTQGMHTDERLKAWVAQVKPLLLEKLTGAGDAAHSATYQSR